MKTSIIVQNLKCDGCAKTIISKLSELENISNIEVGTENATVSFSYVKENDVMSVIYRLKSLGYPSIENRNSMAARAKSFVSCASGKISKS